MQVTPYLNFDGQCAAAFRFYEQLLGGRLEAMMTHGDSPIAEEVPPEWHDRILHARLALRDQVLMGSDSPPGFHERPQGLHVSLQIEDPSDAERVFEALAEDGEVTMPMQRTFWAVRFGMVIDRFGTPWMINGGEDSPPTDAQKSPETAQSAGR